MIVFPFIMPALQALWSFVYSIYLFFLIYLFIWLHWVLVAACRIFSCGMWDLAPWPGIKPRPLALGAWSLSHWTTREVLRFISSTCKNSTSSLSKKYDMFITTPLEIGTCCELNICVPPDAHTNSCWNSKPWCNSNRKCGFQVITVELHEWHQCPYKRDPIELSHPLHHMRIQQEKGHRQPGKGPSPEPNHAGTQPPGQWETNVCCL